MSNVTELILWRIWLVSNKQAKLFTQINMSANVPIKNIEFKTVNNVNVEAIVILINIIKPSYR